MAIAVAALVGACAQAPSAPEEPVSAPVVRSDGTRDEAIRRHRELAREARSAGDLATALDHLHVVTMLAPGDEAARREAETLRAEIQRGVRENLEIGRTAMRGGDNAKASSAFLRVLSLEPRNAEAARSLREIDRQNMARAQANRAARVRVEDLFADARAARAASPGGNAAASASATSAANDYELEQRIEMLRAGDSVTALRELKAWVDAHPKDRAGRQRIGAAVAERAKEAEGKGQRETALGLYEQALALRGEPQAEWSARIAALRKSVANDYYNDGVRLMRTDLDGAVVALEKAVRLDPQNANAANRLREAKAARDKLSRMPGK